jgi:hypothetical protein
MNSAEAHERLMSNPKFWEMFGPLFSDEKMVIEFSEVSGIPAERIRVKRLEYLNRKYRLYTPHIHKSNGTIN